MEKTFGDRNFQINEDTSLSEFAGHNNGIILVLSPYIDSLATNIFLKSLQKNYYQFSSIGWEIVVVVSCELGMSEQIKNNYHLTFPIVEDIDNRICTAFGLLGNEYFSQIQQPKRICLLLDSNLQVLRKFSQIEPAYTVDLLLEFLKDEKEFHVAEQIESKDINVSDKSVQ